MPFLLPRGGNRITKPGARIRANLAASEKERGPITITLPHVGAEYRYADGVLLRDGAPLTRSDAR